MKALTKPIICKNVKKKEIMYILMERQIGTTTLETLG